MNDKRRLIPLGLFGVAMACRTVPVETQGPPLGREVVPSGILRGSVVYVGPHPCSRDGHIVGAAVIFVFDRRNPPPPNGTASTPVNFGTVSADALFANEPRNPGATTYCPSDNGITDTLTVNAPFVISPVPAGSYQISAFYDYTGDFLPTLKVRNNPERGDIGGGDVDELDALQPAKAGDPNYQPIFVPVNVGTPQPLPDGSLTSIPDFIMPESGVVVDNINITMGQRISTTRPYFYPGGLAVDFDPASGNLSSSEVQSTDAPPTNRVGIAGSLEKAPEYVPILTIPQDIQILAPPKDSLNVASVNNYEASLPHLLLHGSLPKAEYARALLAPFMFQLPSPGQGEFSVWQNAVFDETMKTWIPQDAVGAPGLPQLWPSVALTKLVDDPTHAADPASLATQGSPTAPLVVLQAVTLLQGDGSTPGASDSLYNSGAAEAAGALSDRRGKSVIFVQDHLTVAIEPFAICFNTLYDAANPDKRGTLVTPHLQATAADVGAPSTAFLLSPDALNTPGGLSAQVNRIQQACLPLGRYAINVVYPDGQAWTVPNEAGGCTTAEGTVDYKNLACTGQPRPVLYSQGSRAIVEIVKATNPANCAGDAQVPAVCLPTQPQ